jgi:prepilin-type processing-associated H-X9-DG protein
MSVDPCKRSRRWITEVGCLLIIGGTLAVLLVPVLEGNRARARQAVCLANVRSVCRAVRMYLCDNDQRFPPREHRAEVTAFFNTYPGGGDKSKWDVNAPGAAPDCHRSYQANPYLRWPVVLDSYMATRQQWQCPSAILQGGAFFINGAGADWLSHLKEHQGQWGRITESYLCPAPSWPAGWGGQVTDSILQQRLAVPISGKGRTASGGVFTQSIGVSTTAGAEPSALAISDARWYVVCADAGATVDAFCTGTLAYPDLCHLECAGPGDWEADWENCPWSRACGAIAAMKTDAGLRKPYARHYGGVNIGFLDGHARWMHSETVIAEAPSHGNPNRGRLRGFSPWGPTSDAGWYDPSDGIPALY